VREEPPNDGSCSKLTDHLSGTVSEGHDAHVRKIARSVALRVAGTSVVLVGIIGGALQAWSAVRVATIQADTTKLVAMQQAADKQRPSTEATLAEGAKQERARFLDELEARLRANPLPLGAAGATNMPVKRIAGRPPAR
jgi:hypothetical protein